MRVRCWTTFDITITGVKSHYSINRLPFRDRQGTAVDSAAAWHRARNQQRNWDTINQLLSLRTLPHSITDSVCDTSGEVKIWSFEFSLDHDDAFAQGDDIFGSLIVDCKNVPMITGLTETPGQVALLDPGHNIGFQQIPNK